MSSTSFLVQRNVCSVSAAMSTLGYASFRRRVPTSSARRLPTRILPKEALAMPKSPLIRLRRQTGRSLSASILPKVKHGKIPMEYFCRKVYQ